MLKKSDIPFVGNCAHTSLSYHFNLASCRFTISLVLPMIQTLKEHGLFYGGFLGLKGLLVAILGERLVMILFH
jgi:hypothetical protein